jgi:tRNA (guanine-N7-)-methyltransferase
LTGRFSDLALSTRINTLTGFMTSTETCKPLRRIPSFVRREGRMTAGQQRALQEFWPRFGVDSTVPVDPAVVFGRVAPLTLEIGFGNGDTLLTMAKEYPDCDYLGIEHRPASGAHASWKSSSSGMYVSCAVTVISCNLPRTKPATHTAAVSRPVAQQRHHNVVSYPELLIAGGEITARQHPAHGD